MAALLTVVSEDSAAEIRDEDTSIPFLGGTLQRRQVQSHGSRHGGVEWGSVQN